MILRFFLFYGKEHYQSDDYDDGEYKEPLLEVYAQSTMQTWGDMTPLLLSFDENEQAILPISLTVAFINPYSTKADLAASFQAAVVDVLVTRTIAAAKAEGVSTVAIAGGVASNSALRNRMREVGEANGMRVLYPEPVLCTDNAAMIGAAAYYEYMAGVRHGLDLNAMPSLKLGERI